MAVQLAIKVLQHTNVIVPTAATCNRMTSCKRKVRRKREVGKKDQKRGSGGEEVEKTGNPSAWNDIKWKKVQSGVYIDIP